MLKEVLVKCIFVYSSEELKEAVFKFCTGSYQFTALELCLKNSQDQSCLFHWMELGLFIAVHALRLLVLLSSETAFFLSCVRSRLRWQLPKQSIW